MSKHNYSQYSNKNKQNNANNPNCKVETAKEPVVKKAEATVDSVKTPEVKMDTTPEVVKPEVNLVQETVETVTLPETVEGVVSGCAKLNVRIEPNITAEVVCVLDTMSEIEIDVAQSNNEWFKICTATGIEGYCMRKYVEAHL